MIGYSLYLVIISENCRFVDEQIAINAPLTGIKDQTDPDKIWKEHINNKNNNHVSSDNHGSLLNYYLNFSDFFAKSKNIID